MDDTQEGDIAYNASARIPVTVLVEARPTRNRFLPVTYVAAGVVPGEAAAPRWAMAWEREGATGFLAGGHSLELYRTECGEYAENLDTPEPSLYVVLRARDDDNGAPVDVVLVSASAHAPQAYLVSSEEIVDVVPMAPALRQVIEEFVARHYRVSEFKKRKRGEIDLETPMFGKEPIFDPQTRRRRDDQGET